MSDPTDLPKQRYRLLLEQMRDEKGDERGWKTWAGERLGVTGEYVAMVLKDERAAGLDAIAKAIEVGQIDSEFFFNPAIGDAPRYRDFIGPKDRVEPAFWAEFKRRYEHIGELTDRQLADIRVFAARNLRVRSWLEIERIAEHVRTSQPSTIED